jgi:hypothetical protein
MAEQIGPERVNMNVQPSPAELEVMRAQKALNRDKAQEGVRCRTLKSIALPRPARNYPPEVHEAFEENLTASIIHFENRTLAPGVVVELSAGTFRLFEAKGFVEQTKEKLTPWDELPKKYTAWMQENNAISAVRLLRGMDRLTSGQQDKLQSLEKFLRDRKREIPRMPRDDE